MRLLGGADGTSVAPHGWSCIPMEHSPCAISRPLVTPDHLPHSRVGRFPKANMVVHVLAVALTRLRADYFRRWMVAREVRTHGILPGSAASEYQNY